MHRTVVASRVFILSSQTGAQNGNSSKEIHTRLEKTGLKVLQLENFIIAHDANISQPAEGQNFLLIDVHPGTAHYIQSTWDTMPQDVEGYRRMLERDAQVFNLFTFHSGGFTIYSDFLGIKPLHVCETNEYMAIASKIIDLRDVLDISLSETDPLAIAELIYFGTPLEKRTLHKRIQRLPGSGHTRWSQDEGFVQQDTSLPDPIASISLEKAMNRVNGTFVESVRERLDRSRGLNLVTLSGGFDSRLIAAKIKELAAPLQAYSYGQKYHTEIKAANKVAKALKIDHVLVPYPSDNYVKNIYLHVQAMEGQCETHSTQMCNLLKIDADKGSTVFIGFLGDPLQGSHLSWLKDDDYNSLDSIAEGIFLHHFNEPLNACVMRLGLRINKDDILHALHMSLGKKDDNYFALLLWDWNNRQRRYVGSHFALLGTKFRVTAPYYDSKVINTWLSLPRIALDNRYLFREILGTYHPALAEIPHTYEKLPIRTNLRAELSSLLNELPHQILRKLRLMKSVKRVIPWRNPTIHRLSRSATSFKQRHYQIERIKASKPYLENELSLYLDDKIFNIYMSHDELSYGQLEVLRKLFGLSAFATRLAGKGDFGRSEGVPK